MASYSETELKGLIAGRFETAELGMRNMPNLSSLKVAHGLVVAEGVMILPAFFQGGEDLFVKTDVFYGGLLARYDGISSLRKQVTRLMDGSHHDFPFHMLYSLDSGLKLDFQSLQSKDNDMDTSVAEWSISRPGSAAWITEAREAFERNMLLKEGING